jgi:hypothetical protein
MRSFQENCHASGVSAHQSTRGSRAHQPLTRTSGRKKTITARYVHNSRLAGALHAQALPAQAQPALSVSPGARAFYDQQCAVGHAHDDALRRFANRLWRSPALERAGAGVGGGGRPGRTFGFIAL